eukprot:CAMPEP_0184305390 /NCGR_PEP_ID=MMETSP1049-20130417/14687_1 /TAXON_ID=77928 /ORGANISM="Proteomonas sulcata, Strain CCMP704" /LENGTH=620 /DNA_ID=CAMNT_0026617449 /DNA_START=186 /DNA_END=2048 /DNA_ORIENTATION=+
MGYGDVLPVNHRERMFLVFVALIGAVVFSFSMGNITSLISQTTGVGAKFDDKLRAVAEYLEFRKIQVGLKRRIKSFFGGCWRKSGKLHEEERLLAELPKDIRRLLMLEIYPHAVKTVPLLKGLSHACAAEMFIRLVMVNFQENDDIYLCKEPADDLYILHSGSAKISYTVAPNSLENARFEQSRTASLPTSPKNNLLNQSTTDDSVDEILVGDCFGEFALFPEICMYRTETVKASSESVTCYKLSRKDFTELCEHFPELYHKFYTLCKLKAAWLGVSNEQMEQLLVQDYREKSQGQIETKINLLKADLHKRKEDSLEESTSTKVFKIWRYALGGDPHIGYLKKAKPTNPKWMKVSISIQNDGKIKALSDDVENLLEEQPATIGKIDFENFHYDITTVQDNPFVSEEAHFSHGTHLLHCEVLTEAPDHHDAEPAHQKPSQREKLVFGLKTEQQAKAVKHELERLCQTRAKYQSTEGHESQKTNVAVANGTKEKETSHPVVISHSARKSEVNEVRTTSAQGHEIGQLLSQMEQMQRQMRSLNQAVAAIASQLPVKSDTISVVDESILQQQRLDKVELSVSPTAPTVPEYSPIVSPSRTLRPPESRAAFGSGQTSDTVPQGAC